MSAPILWITGRPAAGKTTLGRRIVAELESRGVHATLLDSDEVRSALTPDARYDVAERALVYRAIAYTATRLAEEGTAVVVAATAHAEWLRSAIRAICPWMLLLHARCPPEVCEARDPKGLYRRAHAVAGTLPGVGEAFEEPAAPDLVVHTEAPVPDDVVASIASAMIEEQRRAC